MNIDIPHGADLIMSELTNHGYESYIVGGCVRDSLLGKSPHDWDICTNAAPLEVSYIFKTLGLRVIETGLKHGTVTIHLDNGENYEVTTFRLDGEYSDGRHPDEVRFVSDIKEDLSRRDFTINAMAYNRTVGLVDPFGGLDDLNKGIVRCVGNPYERFSEDALRILRALRFASTYNFTIDKLTGMAAYLSRELLKNISAERIREELCKIICGKGVELYLQGPGGEIIREIIPELDSCVGFQQNNPYHRYDVYKHIALAVSAYEGDDISVKMALLLHDIGKPRCYSEHNGVGHFFGHGGVSRDVAEVVMDRLKFDTKTKNEVLELILYHDADIYPRRKIVRRWLNKVGYGRLKQLMEVRKADVRAQWKGFQDERLGYCNDVISIADSILADQECFKLKDLAVNGYDICELGVRGPVVGKILNHLLEMVMDEKLNNEKTELMNEARNYLKGERHE